MHPPEIDPRYLHLATPPAAAAQWDLGSIAGPVVGGYIAAAVGLRGFFWVGPPLAFVLFGLLLWQTTRSERTSP